MKFRRSIWLRALAIAIVLVVAGCKRSRPDNPETSASSLIFGGASPEAQRALSTPVDFRLTEDNFAEWEDAQRNLDALPRSALPSGESSAGNPIDRAVERLESSPRARTAIERTGLTVRDFVLETIALAQATEAMASANSSSIGEIPPENLQFVQAHRSRVVLARSQREEPQPPEGVEAENPDLVPATPPVPEVGTAANAENTEQPVNGTALQLQQGTEKRDTTPPTLVRPPTQDSARDTIPPPR